jgi:cell division septal protein FtsQ
MKKRGLIAILAILLLAGASYILGWSTFFTVSAVEIKGTNLYLPQSIKPGEKLARVEPRAVAATYEKIDFVRDANVSRNWISGKVTITITMRTPIAIYNNLAIDALGKSFALDQQSSKSLPRIQAPTATAAVSAVDFFTNLPQEMKSGMTALEVKSSGVYVLHIKVDTRLIQVVWGTATENTLKTRVYKALLAQRENAKIIKMDLSAPHAPIVR